MSTVAGHLITVHGPIPAAEAGMVLPHEHIMVDFIGAEQTGTHRWDRGEVQATMVPHLRAAMDHGCACFVDCSPMYLGRDVLLLHEVATATGLHILTNTGLYKEPFLPAAALAADPERIAAGWIAEWADGIDGTEVRPGFIKTAVNPGPVDPMQRKITEAAAITQLATGLTIATHTGLARAADDVLAILERRGVDPARWIFVHAQNEPERERLLDIARAGAWVELDGIAPDTVDEHLARLLLLLEAGFQDQVLLSHDGGWYAVGDEPGAPKRSFTVLFEQFRPAAEAAGVTAAVWDALTVTNPARAYAVAG